MTNDYDAWARERWIAEPAKAEPVERDEFVRDRARVLHSVALRRLAARTQVVGVGESDFPRTRLTHSLECAQIGRELAVSLGADADLVDTACLAHDLGHPPFGHNGETALAAYADRIGGFEGNAQSLRVLTRLEAKVAAADGSSGGLNLTRATLDAASKYPWPRRDGTSKFGVYPDDLLVFEWFRADAATGARCIEAQIMDWADDVAYSVHDLEDGVQAGHVPLERVHAAEERAELVRLAHDSYLDVRTDELGAALERLTAQEFWLDRFDGSMRAMVGLKRMTSELIGRLCGAATRATIRSSGKPLRRYGGDVIVPAQTKAECAVLKAIADRYVMQREVAIRAQQVQRERLAELLEALEKSAPTTLEPWLRVTYEAAPDDDARLRVVVDQVASLTDTSAAAWHERLVGS
ncbi:MAG TPA: deoxyguanosinetriphosphate triphosphohydrolase [Mycobacteriales bacterium]|jgi:dGTPase|nr:deoxyguanosinetriphosphate triphosphohydrolase [Mycobacteriales bacterium]